MPNQTGLVPKQVHWSLKVAISLRHLLAENYRKRAARACNACYKKNKFQVQIKLKTVVTSHQVSHTRCPSQVSLYISTPVSPSMYQLHALHAQIFSPSLLYFFLLVQLHHSLGEARNTDHHLFTELSVTINRNTLILWWKSLREMP